MPLLGTNPINFVFVFQIPAGGTSVGPKSRFGDVSEPARDSSAGRAKSLILAERGIQRMSNFRRDVRSRAGSAAGRPHDEHRSDGRFFCPSHDPNTALERDR